MVKSNQVDSAGTEEKKPPVRSMKVNFSWAFLGNVVFFFCRWAMLLVLVKLGSATVVGEYSLALAICMPVYIFSQLQLKAALTTDAKNEYCFGSYLSLRLVTTGAAIIICLAIAWLSGYPSIVREAIVVVSFGLAVYAIRDITLALMMKQERLELYSISQIIQAVISLASFGTTFYLTRNLIKSLSVMVAFRLLGFLSFDVFVTRYILRQNPELSRGTKYTVAWQPRILFQLALVSLPLGINLTIVSLRTNVPRYILEAHYDPAELGYFSAIASLLVAMNMIQDAMGQSAVARLSKYYLHNRRAFKRVPVHVGHFALGKLLHLDAVTAKVY